MKNAPDVKNSKTIFDEFNEDQFLDTENEDEKENKDSKYKKLCILCKKLA